MTDPTPDPTPTRDEAPDVLAKQITAAASDMCEIARIANEWRNGPRQSLTAIREIRGVLASAPAPASGRVDAVAWFKAIDDFADEQDALMRRTRNPQIGEMASIKKTAARQIKDVLASLSPAATPVSEAGGEAIAFITKLVHMQSGQGWSRAVVRDAAANFLKLHGIAITGHADTTAEIAALAKPASSPAGGDVDRIDAMFDAFLERYDAHDGCPSVHDLADYLGNVRDAVRAALSQSTSAGRVGE